MKIKDLENLANKGKPFNLSPENNVSDALQIMCEENIGSIIITNSDNTIAGIVTERDIVTRVLGKNKNLNSTKLSDIMSTKIRVAKENDQLIDWLRVMSNDHFRHLPIVDKDNKLISIMSQGDFVAYTWPDLNEQFKRDLKGRLGWSLQVGLILFAIVTLYLIALKI